MKLPAFIILATALLGSCAENPSVENKSEETTVTTHEEEIQLNNGQKWKVDPQMLAYIRKMESEVVAFDTAAEYSVLAQSLQANIDSLTSNCTMKGQAHDELHKWLLPYIETAEELATADQQQAPAVLQKLRDSFVTFNQYFE